MVRAHVLSDEDDVDGVEVDDYAVVDSCGGDGFERNLVVDVDARVNLSRFCVVVWLSDAYIVWGFENVPLFVENDGLIVQASEEDAFCVPVVAFGSFNASDVPV